MPSILVRQGWSKILSYEQRMGVKTCGIEIRAIEMGMQHGGFWVCTNMEMLLLSCTTGDAESTW